jgi:hypothetical protein
MSAGFTRLAVAYGLGGGVLRRKGAARRPWLELQRLETEATYLGHQVRALRAAGRSSVRAVEDMRPGRGFYDISRARIRCPILERAIEILGEGEQQRITAEALQVSGWSGIAALWLDAGCWLDERGRIVVRDGGEAQVLAEWLASHGIRCRARDLSVSLEPAAMGDLCAATRPETHRSMRHALRPGSVHGLQLLKPPCRS